MKTLLDAVSEQIADLEDSAKRINSGDWTFSDAGDYFHTYGIDEVISLLVRVSKELKARE